MPRFVVLRHETPPGAARPPHWDLMFEYGTALRTWAVQELPNSEVQVEAERLADHRREYLEYVGPVSQGRGSVSQWDAGDYEISCDGSDRWTVHVCGQRWAGELSLWLSDERARRWTAHFVPD